MHQALVIRLKNSTMLPLVLVDSSSTNALINRAVSGASFVVHLRTTSTSCLSRNLIPIASLFQTSVVQMANGPFGRWDWLSWSYGSVFWRVEVIPPRIRFAITTSVNTRSPTTIKSSAGIGDLRDEKYSRSAVIHEYAGLRDWCRRTGTDAWKATDSHCREWAWLAMIIWKRRTYLYFSWI